MDYQSLWERLIKELSFLINQEVTSVHPRIVLDYMGFLKEIEGYKDEQVDKNKR